MKAIPIDLDSISRRQWTVIINNCKYKTTKQTAFFISPVLRSFAEKHPTLNSCKIDIEGAEDHENLIATILKLRGTFNITLNNYDFIKRFCESLRISLFESQLTEFEEKVVTVSRSVSNDPHIRILRSLEHELLRISEERIEKVFDALSRAADLKLNDNSDVDLKPKKSSVRSPRSKKDGHSISQNSSTEEIHSIPIVKSTLTVCAAVFGLCISQPQNIDMFVKLISMLSKETIELFKRMVFMSNFETQEESFLAKMMEHQGLIKPEEMNAFNKGKIIICERKRTKNALRSGLNYSVIDINSIWNEQKNVMQNESIVDEIGEAFATFFADLATQKQLKSIGSKFETFELNLPSISKNNWEIHKNLSFSGRNEHPIAIAIRKDDVDTLQKLVSDPSFKPSSTIKPSIYERFSLMNVIKKDKNDEGDDGIKLIDFAAFFGALKCFKYLLLNGFEFSPMSFNYAICGGVSEIIHICEDKKCQSKNSLFYAIQFHRHDILTWLIDTKGENPNEDPLKIAKCVVKYFNMGALVDLIQRGFDPNFFVTPAIECGNLLLVEYLATVNHINFNQPIQLNKMKTIPIIKASIVGFDLDIVKFLIKYCKCDLNQVGKFELTPLHIACLKNDEETVNYLLQQKKINVMVKTEIFFNYFVSYKGITPFHIACQIGAVNIVNSLLQNDKIDVNFGANLDDENVTPLHIACNEGCLNVVKILFAHQKVNKFAKTKKYGFTPFHFACQSGNLNLVQFFKTELKESVNMNDGVDKNQLTPLHVASYSGRIDVVTFLLKQPNINVNSKAKISNEVEYILY